MSEQWSTRARLLAIIREAREFQKALREAPRHRSVLQLLRDAHTPWAKLQGHYHAVARWLDVDFWAEVGGDEAAKAIPTPVGKALRALMQCREEILPLYNPITLGCCPGLTVSPPPHVDPRLVCWEENSVTWYGMGPKHSPNLWDEAHCLAEGQRGSKFRKLSKAIDALETALQKHLPACSADTKTDTGKKNEKPLRMSRPRNMEELIDLSKALKKGEKAGETKITVAKEFAEKRLKNCKSLEEIGRRAHSLLRQYRRYRDLLQ